MIEVSKDGPEEEDAPAPLFCDLFLGGFFSALFFLQGKGLMRGTNTEPRGGRTRQRWSEKTNPVASPRPFVSLSRAEVGGLRNGWGPLGT